MDMPELPPELRDLEDALMSRQRPVREDSRARILAGVKRELLLRRNERAANPWHFAIGLAATVLLCLNLAMSAATNTRWNSREVSSPQNHQVLLEQLRAVLPELSEEDARRYALMLNR